MCWVGAHLHIVCHQVDGVEAHTKLANQVHVIALLHLLQECCTCMKCISSATAAAYTPGTDDQMNMQQLPWQSTQDCSFILPPKSAC